VLCSDHHEFLPFVFLQSLDARAYYCTHSRSCE
jgi:hypothetical protein